MPMFSGMQYAYAMGVYLSQVYHIYQALAEVHSGPDSRPAYTSFANPAQFSLTAQLRYPKK